MKKRNTVAIVICLFLLLPPGCKMYEQVTLSTTDFFFNEDIKTGLKDYNIYVHDKTSTYKLIYPKFADSTLLGKPELVVLPEEIQKIKDPRSQRQVKEHKLDINIYSKKTIFEPSASIEENDVTPAKEIKLTPSAIDKIQMYADDDKSTFARIAIITLIVLGGIAITFLIVWGIISVGNASSDSSNGSDSGSGDSGSGDSGGSNSDSGGSGCYIATMVYGSYEAPEVMVLRKFRDEVLSRSAAGRGFIKVYYKYSPRFVERFRNSVSINKNIKFILDYFVRFLSENKSI